MELEGLRRNWEAFARSDPLGAILADPDRAGAVDTAEFFASGELAIEELMRLADGFGLPGSRRDALDFGCGIGRLSQALATRFENVVGVDVAETMVELARRYNRYGDRCRYLVNAAPSLGQLGDDSFDLVLSELTLQHMGRELAEGYVTELARVLRPGGLLVFQLPSALRHGTPLERAASVRRSSWSTHRRRLRRATRRSCACGSATRAAGRGRRGRRGT